MSETFILEAALEAAKTAGACEVDAVLVLSDSVELRVRHEDLDFIKQAQEKTLGIRALVQGRSGRRSAMTSTSDLRIDTVKRMALETVALARAAQEDPCAGIPSDGFALEIPDLQLYCDTDRNFDIDAQIDLARRAEAAARHTDPCITNSEGSQADSTFSTIFYANSAGFLENYTSALHSLYCEPLAEANGSKQRDSWLTLARMRSQLSTPENVGRIAAERALRRLGGRRISTCEVPVIFDSRTAPSVLGHLLACVNGYAVYRQASYLADKLGQRIGNELIQIFDDGRLPRGLGSKPFDGEGLATRKNVIVEKGILQTYLLDSYAAKKLGLQSTGNATLAPGSAPSVAPTNAWLAPGTSSLAEMIAQTSRGLLVTELIGMGFNPVTGDYSRGAAGLWIEKGEIAYPVEEITIASNLATLLSSVDAIASELHWLGRIAAPEFRVAKMTVAGS